MILSDGNYYDQLVIEAPVDGHHEISVVTRLPGCSLLLSIKEIGIEGHHAIATLTLEEAWHVQHMLLSAINNVKTGGAQ